jgi:hypothetical protein
VAASDPGAGLGLELAAEVLRNPLLLDLLVSFLYTAVHGGRVGLMYPSTVQRQQPDGTARSFVNHDGNPAGLKKARPAPLPPPPPTAPAAAATPAAAAAAATAAAEFPAARMNLPLLKEVLAKMPPIASLQAWARGDEAPTGERSFRPPPKPTDPLAAAEYAAQSLAAKAAPAAVPASAYAPGAAYQLPGAAEPLPASPDPRLAELPAERGLKGRGGAVLRRKLDEVARGGGGGLRSRGKERDN